MEGPTEEKGRTSLPDYGGEIEAKRSVSLVSEGGPRDGPGGQAADQSWAPESWPRMHFPTCAFQLS